MNRSLNQHFLRACAGLLLAAIVGCSSDSPTAPSQNPGGGGGGGVQPATAWRITVTATPDSLPVGSTSPSLVVVEVRRADNGQAAPDGIAVSLTATLGEFGELGSGLRQIAVRLSGGRAGVAFFPGNTPGTATIAAQLENSIGSDTVLIAGFSLTRVVPATGRPEGGDTITIFGQGIDGPVRVEFSGGVSRVTLEVLSVAADRIVARTPPLPPGSPGGNVVVDVTVTTNVGEPNSSTATLSGGFTYASSFVVDRIEPRQVLARGGETVDVIGQGFVAPVRVVFGTIAGEVLSVQADRIQVRTPAIELGNAAEVTLDAIVTIRVGGAGELTDTLEDGITFIADPEEIFFLSTITPNRGSEHGGDTVTIRGGGFRQPMRITFDERDDLDGLEEGRTAPIISLTPTEVVVSTPAFEVPDGDELVVDVIGTINPNTPNEIIDTLDGAFTYTTSAADTFFISSVSPDRGDPSGGETVDILGGGFEAPIRVTFGGSPAQVVSSSRTRIRVLTPRVSLPSGQTLSVPVSVTVNYNEAEQQTDSVANAFTYGYSSVNPPVILSVTPATGPNEGGTTVRIRGSGFENPIQVVFGFAEGGTEFNGVEANVVSVTSTEIVVTTPAAAGFGSNMANNTVDIRVRNLNSGLNTVMADAFRYGVSVAITAIQPNRGPYTGNTSVTIFGSGFSNPLQVTIGNVQQQVISVTGTEIVFRTAATTSTNCTAAGTGAVRVQLLESPGLNATGPTFIYEVIPIVLSGVSPGTGAQTGGLNVTITGSGLNQPVASFGDQTATVVSSTATQVVARTPAFTVDFEEVECDDSPGDGQVGARFVPTAVDVSVRSLANGCSDTLENAFTVSPTDNTCRNDDAVVVPTFQCTDGFDNDGDTFIDALDPQCTGPTDNAEGS